MSPRLLAHGYWLNAFVNFFLYAFTVFIQPDLANDPKSRVGVGVGAFNLTKTFSGERSEYRLQSAVLGILTQPPEGGTLNALPQWL